MISEVFFQGIHNGHFSTIYDNLKRLISYCPMESVFQRKEQIAVKISFGEFGNLNYIRPQYVKIFLESLRSIGTLPFLTDTCTLYKGKRNNAVEHLENAVNNGFGYDNLQTPLIIADGLKGNNYIHVKSKANNLTYLKIASDIYFADGILCLSHFKLHELTGFGGALKNLGMGCAAKAGKIAIHSDIVPTINKRCEGCGKCLIFCDTNAIVLKDKQASILSDVCIGCGNCTLVCPNEAIKINWDSKGERFTKKMVDYAEGVVRNKKKKSVFVNFLTNITPVCDCVNYTPQPILPDIGFVLSKDPVACDAASLDIIKNIWSNISNRSQEFAHRNSLSSIYPDIVWEDQLSYAETIGLGTTNYQLTDITPATQTERERLSVIAQKM